MQMLLYLADFEELRIIQSLRDFGECDKEALARSLWLYHRDKPKVCAPYDRFRVGYKLNDFFRRRSSNLSVTSVLTTISMI